MSSSIWTRCAAESEEALFRSLKLTAWRVVEAQHQISTRKLVDTDAEQLLLEEMIEGVKPKPRAPRSLHYLLATPFRYPPLRNGSRFSGRHEPSLWYGSMSRDAALAEVAYYRLVFLDGTHANLGVVHAQLTAFTVRAHTNRGIDLHLPPFDTHRRAIASPTKYQATQALGAAMRAAGVELFRYPSARDPLGVNVGAFTPKVFGNAQPRAFETWHCVSTKARVECTKRDYLKREAVAFERERFLVEGTLPVPAP